MIESDRGVAAGARWAGWEIFQRLLMSRDFHPHSSLGDLHRMEQGKKRKRQTKPRTLYDRGEQKSSAKLTCSNMVRDGGKPDAEDSFIHSFTLFI